MIKLFSFKSDLCFEKTLNLAQQSQISFISELKKTKIILQIYIRGITCGADNLADYQSSNTSTHTNCLIQIVKERFAECLSEEAYSTSSQVTVKVYFLETLFSFPSNSLLPSRLLRFSLAGRAFYIRSRHCQADFQVISLRIKLLR